MTGRVVGVIGGMGPAATVRFLSCLVELTPARSDQDHLRVIVDMDPSIPDRGRGLAGVGPSPGPRIVEIANDLVARGANVLAMPCNTAHAYAADIRDAVDIEFVDIIDSSVATLNIAVGAKVGVLATTATNDAGLYSRALEAAGFEPMVPSAEDQTIVMQSIAAIKRGDVSPAIGNEVLGVAASLMSAGAHAIIVGCTELPLAIPARADATMFVDSTRALAAATVRIARSGG